MTNAQEAQHGRSLAATVAFMGGEFPQALLAGHRRFRAGRMKVDGGALAALAHGQAPRAMVIGCCDSRATPEFVFGATPGALFVLRTVAAWVAPRARARAFAHGAQVVHDADAPYANGAHAQAAYAHDARAQNSYAQDAGGAAAPCAALALEYAVRRLRVPHIVVLGHSDCGGVRAALAPQTAGLRDPLATRGLGTLHEALKELGGGDGDGYNAVNASHVADGNGVTGVANATGGADVTGADVGTRDAWQARGEHFAVARSLENVRGFAFVDDAVRAGALSLHGAWFDIGRCALHILNPRTGALEEAPSPASPSPSPSPSPPSSSPSSPSPQPSPQPSHAARSYAS